MSGRRRRRLPATLIFMHAHTFSYTGPLFEEGALEAAVKAGLGSELFIGLCVSLCVELKALLGLSEAVSPPQGE